MKYLILVLAVLCLIPADAVARAQTKHVILISIDGLRPQAVRKFYADDLPALRRMIREGAVTFNARTDADDGGALSNHAGMFTGRPAKGPGGHGLTVDDAAEQTVHDLKGSRVESVFDVLRQNNLTSVMASSRREFDVFARSFPIDTVNLTDGDDGLTADFALSRLAKSDVPTFLFIHFAGPGNAGRSDGWSIDRSSKYMQVLFDTDIHLWRIMKMVDDLNDNGEPTTLILTTGFGGFDAGGDGVNDLMNYRIPLIIWGADAGRLKDLYRLNTGSRLEPRRKQISYSRPIQPIRNGEAANLVLRLLGLGCVPGSSIGCELPLDIR